MGFITKTDGLPNFSQATISVWFRIPPASFTAARTQYDNALAVFPNTDFSLAGVIPVVTYGPNTEIYTIYDAGGVGVNSTGAISPCVIGVSCGQWDGAEYRNVLYARMQYSSGANSPGAFQNVYNDYFQVGAMLSPAHQPGHAAFNGTPIDVSASTWHHVLVSYDLSAGSITSSTGGVAPYISFDRTCPFYWAFDDVNYTSTSLWPNTPIAMNATDVPNGIVSDRCMDEISGRTFAAGSIPTNGKPLSVPSNSGFSSKIYNLEVARLHIYTGVTIDTGVLANRRAFVTDAGRPADPAASISLMGKSPEVFFRTDNDWIFGLNKGTAGSFSATGFITPFDPDP